MKKLKTYAHAAFFVSALIMLPVTVSAFALTGLSVLAGSCLVVTGCMWRVIGKDATIEITNE